jgi:pilus assembly protein FimV
MAFGFGFNREKALAAAEKFVQQGKLQNAIVEYEKIIKEDPKDLTVLNTVGDLCARIGQNEQAANYFKKAGDHYAQDGFTVKAIAIYKKLTRLTPSEIDYVNKLAELYTQQGLISDARAQYMQVADHWLKAGDNNQGARILQRILELDPENTATKSKLADLYLKLGKKDEARDIYFNAAESLYARGAYDAAEEALERVIKMDPQNAAALLLRGMVAVDTGDSSSAVHYLAQVPDIDSRPEGLQTLLRAKLQSNSAEGLEVLAGKLLTLHNDLSGIREVAEWHVANNRAANALRLYENHSTRLQAADRTAFQQGLHALIPKIKDDPEALGIMMRLLEGAADSSHLAEIMELQAHASAQKGDFREARDLYQKLSDIEPDNSLHQQNFKQMQAKLGEDSASRSLSPEEASQAFMVEALEEAAPAVHQNYDPTIEKAIEAALTDAELFVSYNVPAKAIPPLEAVLAMAPRDVTINQRLATLYARSGKYAEAASSCQILSEIYRERGHEKEADQYQEAAQSYSLRAPRSSPARTVEPAHAAGAVSPAMQPAVEIDLPAEQGTPSVQEFSFDVPDHLAEADLTGAAQATTGAADQPVHEIRLDDVDAQPAAETSATSVPGAHHEEVDISSEWEEMLTVEAVEIPTQDQPAGISPPMEAKPEASATDLAAEKISEIQFYIDQEMWDLAKKSILDLTELAPDAPEISNLISAVSAGQVRARTAAPAQSMPVAALPVEPAPIEPAELPIQANQTPEPPSTPPPAIATQPAAAAAKPQPVHEAPEFVIAPVQVSARPDAIVEESPLAEVLNEPKQSVAAPTASATTAAAPKSPSPEVAKAPPPVLEDSPLEEILDVAPAPPAPKVSAKKPKPSAKKEEKKETTEDILSDFVGDLEKTELVDFAPRPKAEPVTPPAPAPAKVAAPVPAAAAMPAMEAHLSSNGTVRDDEANSMLSDMLAELQEETADAAADESDPETHYNLGIAFKEMGLLDEAIGELQKVCHAIDRGNAFSQPIQAYTWLAQCLVDKGAPEAAVRWYQNALKLSGLDDSSRCAIYYDLAAAYEASGDEKSALANFMEVYGSNIDFRDVASRIKALKS